MNFLKHNRGAAWCALVIAVIASVVLGANVSVSRLEKTLLRTYTEDSDRYGSPKADLRRLADYGEQLYAISSAVLGENPSFRDAISDLRTRSETDPLRQKDAADALYTAASLSYNQIINRADVPDAQRQSAISYFYEIDSTRARLMNHEEYAKAADNYNRAVTSFPGMLSAHTPADIYK